MISDDEIRYNQAFAKAQFDYETILNYNIEKSENELGVIGSKLVSISKDGRKSKESK